VTDFAIARTKIAVAGARPGRSSRGRGARAQRDTPQYDRNRNTPQEDRNRDTPQEDRNLDTPHKDLNKVVRPALE
jgi:hypothetical protein